MSVSKARAIVVLAEDGNADQVRAITIFSNSFSGLKIVVANNKIFIM